MFIHYRTEGIVLKEVERGEADRLLTIYTKDFGKIEVFGKAIRKINSKLRSGIQLNCFSEIEFIEGKFHKTLTDSIIIDKFSRIKQSPAKLKIAYRIGETADELLKKEEKDERIWKLISTVFRLLDKSDLDNDQLAVIYYFFFWNLISILGYKPELYFCASCRKKLKSVQLHFNCLEGGVICPDCLKKTALREKKNILIDADTIKILRIILKKDWGTILRLDISASHKAMLKKITNHFLLTISFSKQLTKQAI